MAVLAILRNCQGRSTPFATGSRCNLLLYSSSSSDFHAFQQRLLTPIIKQARFLGHHRPRQTRSIRLTFSFVYLLICCHETNAYLYLVMYTCLFVSTRCSSRHFRNSSQQVVDREARLLSFHGIAPQELPIVCCIWLSKDLESEIGVVDGKTSASHYDNDMQQAKAAGIDVFALNIGIDGFTTHNLGLPTILPIPVA